MTANFFNLNERYSLDAYKPASTVDDIIALHNYFSGVDIPQEYIDFITQLTEAEILVLDGSYVRIWSAIGCIEMNSAYNIQKYIPGSIAIGDDEGGKVVFYANGKEGFGLYKVGFGDLDINAAEWISPSLVSFLIDGIGADLFI
ncbi:SMI1/KNR4 family protein [Aeromonas hydrophila]|uniref:SMI1/KNR4 family protein n=1 Tax=Aeromonas hydrophila TaxID=644 RepID=UPI001FC7DE7F|nr:SMI1/KNR4 family protein [Aeromonas hydrophila]GKQ97318.1 hypothetical protein KAM461_15680 [Aeromonas hydrophila]